jgi:hypothetical protein
VVNSHHCLGVISWRNSACNFVILCLRHDAPRHHVARFAIRTPCHHSIGLCRSHARQGQQLLFSFVAVFKSSDLVAASALAYACRHRLGIALHFRRCLRALLLQVLRVLLLSATRERSQQQNCESVPISTLSAVL